MEKETKAMEDMIRELILKMGMGLSDEQIEKILNGRDLMTVYQSGEFCPRCPAFNKPCTVSPAIKRRFADAAGIPYLSDLPSTDQPAPGA